MFIKKIIIASVLKPVNDARMYEKFGISLADEKKYEVHIIGFPASVPKYPNIIFHSLQKFHRISFIRVLSYWKITKKAIKVKPQIIIVNTFELLIVGLLCKILFGSKLLYDIQENYFRNIWHQNNFPSIIKYPLAVLVRLKEIILSPFVDHFILAEELYLKELKFVKKNHTIILNKYNPIKPINLSNKKKKESEIRFLFSGTISDEYGIKEAIEFYRTLKDNQNISFKIIGHCTNYQLLKQLRQLAAKDDNLLVDISETPIDHSRIEEAYLEADYALAPYPKNKSTENCIPTKFYELIAFEIPIIIPDHNPFWINFLSQYQAFYSINFKHINKLKILASLYGSDFYSNKTNNDIYWSSEKPKLLNILAKF